MGKKRSGKGPTDYEVGRGKPPSHTRFQPGRSGNPGGRKKGSQNTRTVLKAILDSKIVLSMNGKAQKVTHLEALHWRLVHLGLQGDRRAMEYLIDKAEYHEVERQDHVVELGLDDEQIIAEAFRQYGSKRAVDEAGRTPGRGVGGGDGCGIEEGDDEIGFAGPGEPDDDDDDGSDEPNGQPPPAPLIKLGREERS